MKNIQIIPSINVISFASLKEKIRLVEPYVEWVHLDVADGRFTDWKTWQKPKDLFKLKTPLKIEVHLMIADVDKKIEKWLIKPIKRIIFHPETSKNPNLIISKCRKAGIEPGISIKPSISWKIAELPFFKNIRFFQVLGVNPGRTGQKFQPKVLAKITGIKKFRKNYIIEADGGMKKETIKKAVMAGANLIVSASAVFKKPDVKKTIEELKNSI